MSKLWEESHDEVVERLTGYCISDKPRGAYWNEIFPDWDDLPDERKHWINCAVSYSASWLADYQYVIQTIAEQTGLSRLEAMVFYYGSQARQLNRRIEVVNEKPKEPWQE